MEERGEFPTRFIIARRSRPTTTRTIGPPSSLAAATVPCEATRVLVYSFTCTFIFHVESWRKRSKKEAKNGW